jgi:hypothetical protein
MTWVKHNDLLPAERVADTVKQALETVGASGAASAEQASRADRGMAEPLTLDFAPAWLTRWFGGWQAGIAGAILILSTFVSAPKLGLFVIPAALVAVLGESVLPNVGPVRAWMFSSMAGIVIAFWGFRITRD